VLEEKVSAQSVDVKSLLFTLSIQGVNRIGANL